MGVALGVIIHLVIVYLGGDKIHNKMDAVSHPTNRLDNYPAMRKGRLINGASGCIEVFNKY